MTYLLLISAPCSSRNRALALSPLLTALCSSVRPLVVCTSTLAPASSSLLATGICPVHRASSKGVWSSLSDKLKSGTIGRRPPLPRLPVKWMCNLFNEILKTNLASHVDFSPQFIPCTVQFRIQKENEMKVLDFRGISVTRPSKSVSFCHNKWAYKSRKLCFQWNYAFSWTG